MSTKEIEAKLLLSDGKYLLVFSLSKKVTIDLYSDDSDQLKKLFTALIKELINNDIIIKYTEDPSILNEKNQLIRDVASEYINQLEHDIEMLIENDNLKIVREMVAHKDYQDS